MPVSIGEVQSDVMVDPPEQHGPAAAGKVLPTHEEQERWLQLAWRRQWDEARTAADDFDD